jgi:hypothetical protein
MRSLTLLGLGFVTLSFGCAGSQPRALYKLGMTQSEATALSPCQPTKNPRQLACLKAPVLEPPRPVVLDFSPSGELVELSVLIATDVSWEQVRAIGNQGFGLVRKGLGAPIQVTSQHVDGWNQQLDGGGREDFHITFEGTDADAFLHVRHEGANAYRVFLIIRRKTQG